MAEEDEQELELEEAEPPEESPPEDCPPCKAGAPAWMATFADMATLLMAFFVLILSFAHVNVPKYKQVSGSMRMAFGVQTQIPVIEPPSADNIIATQYRTARVDPTPVQTVEEQKTEQPQPEDVELRNDTGPGESETNAAEQALEQALAEQLAQGRVRISTADNKVQVEIVDRGQEGLRDSPDAGGPRGQVDQDTLEIYARVAAAQTETDSLIEVIDPRFAETTVQQQNASASGAGAAVGSSPLDDQYQQIRANLSEQIRDGLAEVERDGDQIIIRLAEQGTFDSGQAELKPEFFTLINTVGASISGTQGRISVEGHTDNVPIGFGSRYRSNWDLSAARSAAVADYLVNNDFVQAGRVSIKGFADSRPLADNDSAIGRASNRRIEIIINGSGSS
ncbi:MAG: OmpA family protein [Pseudohongiellaceae bacterium]